MPNIKDVAKAAQVSTATVSHVINGTRFVSEETRLRVKEAMAELHYTPNSVARNLRSKKSGIIGLLVPMLRGDSSNPFFMSVAQGIESILMENGYNLVLGNTKENVQVEKEQLRLFLAQQIDGLILAPAPGDHTFVGETVSRDIPVVCVDRRPQGLDGDCVLADGRGGALQATRLLIRQGHRRIGFLSPAPGISSTEDRLQGYRQGLEEAGISFRPELTAALSPGENGFDSGCRLASRLYEEGGITALFAGDNQMAMGALCFLQEAGTSLPGKVALVGFDDYDWSRITTPALTVVKQPAFELGQTAARMVLDRIAQPDKEPELVRLPTGLVLRASV
jgi:LacI family transcriptional regulator